MSNVHLCIMGSGLPSVEHTRRALNGYGPHVKSIVSVFYTKQTIPKNKYSLCKHTDALSSAKCILYRIRSVTSRSVLSSALCIDV